MLILNWDQWSWGFKVNFNNYFYTTLITIERCFAAFCWQIKQEKVHFLACNKESWNLWKLMNVVLQDPNVLKCYKNVSLTFICFGLVYFFFPTLIIWLHSDKSFIKLFFLIALNSMSHMIIQKKNKNKKFQHIVCFWIKHASNPLSKIQYAADKCFKTNITNSLIFVTQTLHLFRFCNIL